jgi:cellulose synthase/poly-beta-1,6-N-acetylglucosamine synthase-like glycosyltransferase
MVIAFIMVLGVLVYTWLVYPVVVVWLGRRVAAHSAPPTSDEKKLPLVAVLFSAHNEAAVIRQRLENLAALDYPADRIHVFAGIDGGSDRTAEIALEWARSHPRVHVFVSPENHGKTVMLKRLVENQINMDIQDTQDGEFNDSCPELSCKSCISMLNPLPSHLTSHVSPLTSAPSLLVFTDANTMFAPDALRRLVAPFADPEVGGVCGRLVLESRELRVESSKLKVKSSECVSLTLNSELSTFNFPPESSYWSLETRLKAAESAMDSCLGANGAIYAIRAGLFPAHFPDNTIIDDFVIGMKVREQGQRLVYEPAAVATEELPATVEAEWRRRVRIGAGAYQALALCWRCLLPRYGVFAWMFWSHKVLRWFTPHLLVVSCWLLVVELLRERPWASLSPATQQLGNLTTVCILALASAVVFTKRGWKGLKLLAYFMTMQAALFVGFLRFCKGNLRGTWKRTER